MNSFSTIRPISPIVSHPQEPGGFAASVSPLPLGWSHRPPLSVPFSENSGEVMEENEAEFMCSADLVGNSPQYDYICCSSGPEFSAFIASLIKYRGRYMGSSPS